MVSPVVTPLEAIVNVLLKVCCPDVIVFVSAKALSVRYTKDAVLEVPSDA